MTWQAWVGAAFFYTWMFALTVFGLVWAWDSWRHRACRDEITLGGRVHRCCLRHHHEPRIHRAEGRNAPHWERHGDQWDAWVDPAPFDTSVTVIGHNPPA